ncbi:MAG TPA: TIGR03619 family F420-dependent LLM class oxidoreductase, partial [Myxococcota bacterium]|nr:TIGR03619 family F420-dependent LLM class oxidoreductase [Myxococcota bacterium]
MAGLGVSLLVAGLPRLFGDDLAAIVELGRAADAAGIDQLVLPDHLAIGPRTDRYPYGRWPGPDDAPWLEPLTTLAAIAGVTRRIRLGTGVLIAPLRPALLLAKTAATLDVLSRGRLDLGVGTGWQREEFAAAGVPFRGRTARMDDVLRACRALWRDAPASFRSETVSFEAIRCLPRPVQRDGPPLWIGGAATPGNLARLAEFGAGWMPIGLDDDAFRDGLARAREAFAAAGRDPATLGVRATLAPVRGADGRVDVGASLAGLPRLREL